MNLLIKKTIVHHFLDTIRVPYTKLYLNEFITLQPDHNSLFALSNTLKDYNVDNISIKIDPKEISKIPFPFITQLTQNKDQFVVVLSISGSEITYMDENGNQKHNDLNKFLDNWSAIVLIASKSPKSIEKNYTINRRNQVLDGIKLPLLVMTFIFTLIFYFINNSVSSNSLNIAVIFLTLAGLFVSVLLIIQGFDKNNSFITRICNLNKNTDCNNVLESPVSKFMGIISWSYIGFIYFTGTLLNLIFVADSAPILFILSICTLPYSFWSIYYQWRIAKKWCVLCIAVQFILVLTFILFLNQDAAYGFERISLHTATEFAICLMWALFGILFIMPFVEKANKVIPALQEIKRLKTDDFIFRSYLQSTPQFKIEPGDKNIQFGNPESSFVVTMATSPTCGPCAAAHQELEQLLDQYEDDIRIQIIFTVSSHNEKQNNYIKWLIGVYLTYDPAMTREIYSEWYAGEKNVEVFQRKYPINNENMEIEEIYNAHKEWCKTLSIAATPTLFVNGYKLPQVYKIEDLKYFI